jgi:signal transduction histidine kinase
MPGTRARLGALVRAARLRSAPGRLTLRTRVTLWATSIVAGALLVASLGLVLGLRQSMWAGLDSTARERVLDVTSLIAHGQLRPLIPTNGGEGDLVQVVDASGRVLAGSEHDYDHDNDLNEFPHPLPRRVLDGHPATLSNLHIGDGGDFRVLARPVTVEGRRATIVAAVSLAQAQRALSSLGIGLAIGVPMLTALVAWTVWGTAGRTLRSVETLRRQATEITANDLNRRLGLPVSQDEIHALAVTLNDMLARLAAASAAQRRFVADAAHELRSPLTAIRAQLEVLADYPDPERDPLMAAALLEDTQRLDDLVEDLLALARSEDPGKRHPHGPVDLDEMVLAEVARQRGLTETGIDSRGVSAGRVLGDPEALRRGVRNLLDNARRHAEHRIRVSLAVHSGTVQLTVGDDGAGIPPADRARVFERFTRLDEGRSREAGGSGLGLAIVRKVVAAHGGSVRADQEPDPPRGLGGARLVVLLPTADRTGATRHPAR